MVKDKWLIAESVDGVKQYIIHTEYPRFIAEILDGKDGQVIGNPEWIDRVSPETDVMTIARLMRQAGEALETYDDILEREEDEEEKDKGDE